MTSNLLSHNPSKTEFMLIGLPQQISSLVMSRPRSRVSSSFAKVLVLVSSPFVLRLGLDLETCQYGLGLETEVLVFVLETKVLIIVSSVKTQP